MDRNRFQDRYKKKLPVWTRALEQIKSCLSSAIEDFKDDRLFRVYIVKERVKDIDSLFKKAIKRGITEEDKAFDEINDILGIRLVTNNLKDAERLLEVIKNLTTIEYIPESYQSYVAKPKASGYRAIHFDVFCVVDYKGTPCKVRCEVQIQTLLQNSWSILSHQDIYKNQDDLPEHVRLLTKRLADQLSVLDDIAQDIRDAVTKTVQPKEEADENKITKEGLSNLYKDVFHKDIEDYKVQVWMNVLANVGASTLGDARKLVPGEKIISKMNTIYQSVWGTDEEMPDETLLFEGTLIMQSGENPSAYVQFRKNTEASYDDYISIGRRETLAGLPDTLDELIDGLKDDSVDINSIWGALKELGGVKECERCGADYFDSDTAYEGLVDHYGEEKTELREILYEKEADGGFECESSEASGHCSYCGHMITKDD